MEMERKIRVRDFSDTDFIASRYVGELIRTEMEKAFQDEKCIVLDFEGVNGITQGFGDEIIGIFVRTKGLDFVKKRIKVVNANDKIRVILNWVVGYSKNMGKSVA
ncbi:MAG: STAS-like domain-containing protein [Aquificae bacterium]|nr:STAS-like domain-containing protein [Aquificota bacterium]